HYTSVVGPMIGYWFVIVGCVGAGLVLAGLLADTSTALAVILVVATYLNVLPFMAGFHVVALAQLRGQRWSFSDFFRGFGFFGTLLGNVILLFLVMIGLSIPAAIVTAIFQGASLEVRAAVSLIVSLSLNCISLWMGCFNQQLIVD